MSVTSVILTLIIFTVIVVIHEGGHFAAAKKCNVFIEEFAVGMGPKLFGIKKGDTLYSLRLFPVGGYCRMADEKPEDSTKIGFNDANVFQRIFIAFAGPFMNFVLALVILTIMSVTTGISTNGVHSVMDGYPAQAAGIQAGDKIIAVNGKRVNIRSDLSFYLSENAGKTLELTVKRGKEKLVYNIAPKADKNGNYLVGVNMEAKLPLINVGMYDEKSSAGLEKASFFECVADGWYNMHFLVKITVYGVAKMLTFSVPMSDVSGPIGVTTVVGDAYEETVKDGAIFALLTMLNLSALLSANLGVINLVPIPALDGGRIFVYLIEIIRRKKLPPEKEGVINLIGFVLIMGFGIFVAVNDVIKLV